MVEYWSADGNTARAYWNYGTDKKFGGPGKSGYFIEIKIVPQDYWFSKKIHGWIRQVRPFKGPFGPGNIDQFWQTGKTGEVKEILYEIKACLRSEFSGIPYGKIRTKTQSFTVEERAKQEKIDAIKEAEAEKKWLAGAPARAAKAAADAEAAAAYAAEATERQAEQERAYAAAAKEEQREILGRMQKREQKKAKARKNREAYRKKKEERIAQGERRRKHIKLAIVCVAAIIAGVFVLGNDEISLPGISLPDITGCQTLDSEIINPGPNQDEIYLKLCKEYITVSGDLHKNTKVMMELRNPDGNYFRPMTFVDKIDWKIPTETVEKERGTWKIKITVNGKYTGNVLDIHIVKP